MIRGENMPVGKRVYLNRDMQGYALLEEFRSVPASIVSDVMNRTCGMDSRIHLMSSPKAEIAAGIALTVKTSASDNLMIHAAMNIAQKGDFLIVASEGGNSRALIGEVMMTYLYRTKGISGIVIDGPVRDINEISKWDFPIYATGTNPAGPYKEGPGEINVPVSCGNIIVNPGDIILADSDGAIVIPIRDAEAVLEDAKKLKESDELQLIAAKNGDLKRDWVEKSLIEKGFEIIDDVYRP